MTKLNRRLFLKNTGLGIGGLSFCTSTSLASEQTPHFFLQIQLEGGLDNSYTFDARPLVHTQTHKIVNYSQMEPLKWEDDRGGWTWVSPSMKPLFAFRNDLAIVNGVHMATGFEGHDQNLNYYLTGKTAGGFSHLPELSSSQMPLRTVITSDADVVIANNESLLMTQPEQLKRLSLVMKSLDSTKSLNPLVAKAHQRVAAGEGFLARGTQQMIQGLAGMKRLTSRLAQVNHPEVSDSITLVDQTKLALSLFKSGVTESVLAMSDEDSLELDTHDPSEAKEMPKMATTIAERIAEVMSLLKNTPFDEARGLSFFDVTTVSVSSEFSRTMRQPARAIEDSGTDHNQLNNTVLLFGKSIQGNRIVGRSDLETLDMKGQYTQVSGIHQRYDALKIKLMGLPYDFKGEQTLPLDPHSVIDSRHYITPANIANTLLEISKKSKYRVSVGTRQSQSVAPILRSIIKTT